MSADAIEANIGSPAARLSRVGLEWAMSSRTLLRAKLVRYKPAPPMVGTTGDIEALFMWAG
jgi:hypothetical protein